MTTEISIMSDEKVYLTAIGNAIEMYNKEPNTKEKQKISYEFNDTQTVLTCRCDNKEFLKSFSENFVNSIKQTIHVCQNDKKNVIVL